MQKNASVSPIYYQEGVYKMNENKTVSMYETVPAVSELNKVPGFDPLKYLRRTKDGLRLDVKMKKLWFRLKHPNGRIRLSALKITDQLAIIEARVYFDKDDAQPASSFTAQRENRTTPGGLYIEAAQHSAIDEALSAAGFGIQFIPANEAAATQRAIPKAGPTVQQEKSEPMSKMPEPVVEKTIEPVVASEAEPMAASAETVAETTPPAEDTGVSEAETAEQPTAAEKPEAMGETVMVTETDIPTSPVIEAAAEPPHEEVSEIPEEEETAGVYTKDMPVAEICALMSAEEAGNIIVPTGTCKGMTLSQVADRRPVSLKWYVSGYTGDDNILRAGAKILLELMEAGNAA